MSEHQTKLGAAQARFTAGEGMVKSKGSKFLQTIEGARPFVPWVVPRLGLEVAITLIGSDAREAIEADVWDRMRGLRLELNTTTELIFELARARRVAAIAVVDRVTHLPVGTVDEWGSLDDDILGDFWRAYGDVREAYNPVESPLSEEEIAFMFQCVKKNDARALRLCGVSRLQRLLLSTAGQLVALQRPKSGDSEPSSDTSTSPETSPSPPSPAGL